MSCLLSSSGSEKLQLWTWIKLNPGCQWLHLPQPLWAKTFFWGLHKSRLQNISINYFSNTITTLNDSQKYEETRSWIRTIGMTDNRPTGNLTVGTIKHRLYNNVLHFPVGIFMFGQCTLECSINCPFFSSRPVFLDFSPSFYHFQNILSVFSRRDLPFCFPRCSGFLVMVELGDILPAFKS